MQFILVEIKDDVIISFEINKNSFSISAATAETEPIFKLCPFKILKLGAFIALSESGFRGRYSPLRYDRGQERGSESQPS